MKKLEIGMLAGIGGLLVLAAIVTLKLAIIYTMRGSTTAVLYGLMAISAAIGGKLLFWVAEYKHRERKDAK